MKVGRMLILDICTSNKNLHRSDQNGDPQILDPFLESKKREGKLTTNSIFSMLVKTFITIIP